MTVRGLLMVAALACVSGCITDRRLALELRPPRAPDGGPDVPAVVEAFEVQLSRLDGDEACPLVDVAAAGRTPRLGHAQSFSATDGMGAAIGEVPEGRWALSATARDAACGVVLYGCIEVSIGADAPDVVAVDLAPATTAETCGCRACAAGVCEPVAEPCD